MSRKIDIRCYTMKDVDLVAYAKEKFDLVLDPAAGNKALIKAIQEAKHGRDAAKEALAEQTKNASRSRRSSGAASGKAVLETAAQAKATGDANALAAAGPAAALAEPQTVRKTYDVGLPRTTSTLLSKDGTTVLYPDSDPVLPEKYAFSDIPNLAREVGQGEEAEREHQLMLAKYPNMKIGGIHPFGTAEKPFRHPQETRWLYRPPSAREAAAGRPGVYWPLTETLMRRHDLIPIFQEQLPEGAVLGA